MPRPNKNAVNILLSLLIFTLPFNWFFKGGVNTSYLRGIQIDYLLTKFYLQDFILFSLVFILLYSYRSQIVANLNRQQLQRLWGVTIYCVKRLYKEPKDLRHLALNYLKQNTTAVSFSALAILVSLKTLFTGQLNTLVSLWQLASALALAYYLLKRYSHKELIKLIWKPLLATSIFQAMLGMYQFIQQNSLVGYILFGEIDFSLPGAIARESFFDVLRSLPYGTLPHPNVLAGFLGITTVLMVAKLRSTKPKGLYLIFYYLLLGLFISVILLSRSWVALSGLGLVIVGLFAISRIRMLMLFCLYSIITCMYLVLSTWFIYQSTFVINNQSIIRRSQLNLAGIFVLKDHLWLGTGINQSLIPIHTTYSLIAPADFIQPIHSIYIIWFVETGLIGVMLSIVFLISLTKTMRFPVFTTEIDRANRRRSNIILWFYPLLFVLWLGLFDHYILTLRQGQLMAALTIALGFSSIRSSRKQTQSLND